MHDLTDFNGNALKTEPQAVKVRLAQVYRNPAISSITETMAEIKQLTDKDMDDFRMWFTERGYPCT